MICTVIGIGFALCVLAGWIRGLFKVVISMAGLIASLLVAAYIAPHVSGYLHEHTQIDERIALHVSEKLHFSDMSKETSKGIQVEVIQKLPLPRQIKEEILNNNNSDMYKALDVSGIYAYIAKSIAMVILNTGVFLLLTLFCRIIFFVLAKAGGEFVKLPVVKWMDHLGGGILGGLKGIIVIWIVLLLLSVTSTSEWSQNCMEQVEQNIVLNLLYENNLLLDVVSDLTKVLFL